MSYWSDDEYDEFDYHEPLANYDDYDDDFSTHYHLEYLLARQMLFSRMEQASFLLHNAFIKEWYKNGVDRNQQVVLGPKESTLTGKLTSFFNLQGDGLADLYIGAKGEPKVHAHQVVVVSWSEKLKEIIFQENLTWSLTLLGTPDLELKSGDDLLTIEVDEGKECNAVFQDFMKFMYTESISLNLKTVWPMMQLASKYSVNELLETCLKFALKRVEEISVVHCLEEFMIRAPSLGVSKGIVQMITKRFLWETFLNDSQVVSSLSVDLLCDVLRSSDVVAISEFDIFLKLKPKLDSLKEAGEHRQVLRLLSLLRLTQMTSSELRQFSSSVYMDEIRRAFPGKFKTALWIRALYAEHSKCHFKYLTVLQPVEEIPVNIERPRLYWTYPLHFNRTEGESFISDTAVDRRIRNLQSNAFRDITLVVRKGHQQVKIDPDSRRRDTLDFSVYKVSSGQHGVVKLTSKWTVTVLTGKFSVVTVRVIAPRVPDTIMFKIVLIFNKVSKGQSTPEPRVRILEGHDFPLEGVLCSVDTMETSEDFDVTVRVFGYAFDRTPSRISTMSKNFKEYSVC